MAKDNISVGDYIKYLENNYQDMEKSDVIETLTVKYGLRRDTAETIYNLSTGKSEIAFL